MDFHSYVSRMRREAGSLWTPEEDALLLQHVAKYGTRHWSSLKSLGILPHRDQKACCNRFLLLKRKFLLSRTDGSPAQGAEEAVSAPKRGEEGTNVSEVVPEVPSVKEVEPNSRMCKDTEPLAADGHTTGLQTKTRQMAGVMMMSKASKIPREVCMPSPPQNNTSSFQIPKKASKSPMAELSMRETYSNFSNFSNVSMHSYSCAPLEASDSKPSDAAAISRDVSSPLTPCVPTLAKSKLKDAVVPSSASRKRPAMSGASDRSLLPPHCNSHRTMPAAKAPLLEVSTAVPSFGPTSWATFDQSDADLMDLIAARREMAAQTRSNARESGSAAHAGKQVPSGEDFCLHVSTPGLCHEEFLQLLGGVSEPLEEINPFVDVASNSPLGPSGREFGETSCTFAPYSAERHLWLQENQDDGLSHSVTSKPQENGEVLVPELSQAGSSFQWDRPTEGSMFGPAPVVGEKRKREASFCYRPDTLLEMFASSPLRSMFQ